MQAYLGIDVGSVSTNLVLLDHHLEVVADLYLRTGGRPIQAVQEGLAQLEPLAGKLTIAGVGTTGSGRQLTSAIVGGDTVKNEITAHAVAAQHVVPGVQTILEIGGQDSKIILLRDGVVTDFAMNTVCAAGTGSFLDRQAARLGVPIEEFGDLAVSSHRAVRIAGRCAVFAESDMIHKQQVGHRSEDIVRGLCEALVRNYLNNIGKGKHLQAPVVFQGGVSSNKGIVQAFEESIGLSVTVPRYNRVMGAIGAALLASEAVRRRPGSNFRGFGVQEERFETGTFECHHCANRCEIVEIKREGELLARWGGRCDRWEGVSAERNVTGLAADEEGTA